MIKYEIDLPSDDQKIWPEHLVNIRNTTTTILSNEDQMLAVLLKLLILSCTL